MSISKVIKTNKIIRTFKKIYEMLERIGSNTKIYFPYKVELAHPAFDELKRNPPIKYANKMSAKLFHLMMGSSKKDFDENHMLEIIDHPFSVIASFETFSKEPIEYYNRQNKLRAIYLNDKLKKLIFISKGQRELFKYYFSDQKILNKSLVIPLPWKDNIHIGKKELTQNLTFLFIASNYYTKGVEIVLKAWNKFKMTDDNAVLTLISHDIPYAIEQTLPKSVNLIKQAPLNKELKNSCYQKADVVLAITLTDGITAIEATSYGKPIIVFRTQHSNDFIDNNNGFVIDVPINVYDVDKYGIVWKTKKEFDKTVKEYIVTGKFNKTIDDLVCILNQYSKDTNLVRAHSENAIEKYYRDYIPKNRSNKLLELYDDLLSCPK